MNIKALQTPPFLRNQNLEEFILQQSRRYLKENSILTVASKIVSVAENRFASKKINKEKLIHQESDYYLGAIQKKFHLTIKHQLLIPTAGIDESNSETGDYILYPKNPFLSVKKLRSFICKKMHLKNFGVLMTDSRTFPLRRGVVGVALAYTGFYGIKSLVGKKDIFKKHLLKVTTINIIDALAAAATLLMGEGGESRPLAVIKNAPVRFTNKNNPKEVQIPVAEDLYYPLYKHLLK